MKRVTSVWYLAIAALLVTIFTGCSKDENDVPKDNHPVITAISPTSGTKGTTVTVYGSGFSNDIQDVTVLLNGKQMVVSQATETLIKFIVSPKAGSGLVAVVINGQGASGPSFAFIYTITISTVCGTPGVPGFADGTSGTVRFNQPRGLTLDSQGNLYVADELNHRIRRVSPGGSTITFAGMGIAGHQDGPPGTARFNSPHDIDLDEINGFFYVADKLNHCIRRISLAGDVTTSVGIPGSPGYVDAPGLSARLNNPTGVAVEGEMANIYIADNGNHCIRKCDPFEVVTTYAGSTVDGQQDGTGNGAKFSSPFDIAWDSSGFLFVTDQVNNNIRRIEKSNVEVRTVAGNGVAGFLDGPGVASMFNSPAGICSWFNEVVVCDFSNHRIRNISPDKMVSTIAGDGTGAYQNGSGLQSKFKNPGGIVRNSEGDYFISDTENHCIRKMVVD